MVSVIILNVILASVVAVNVILLKAITKCDYEFHYAALFILNDTMLSILTECHHGASHGAKCLIVRFRCDEAKDYSFLHHLLPSHRLPGTNFIKLFLQNIIEALGIIS